MSSHVFRILRIESLEQNERLISLNSNDEECNLSNFSDQSAALSNTQLFRTLPFWIPSNEFNLIKNKFESDILAQYTCLPGAPPT
ncbi:hypothetical protein Glove_50g42 [Diversispora epigaea]|uniref:Uncharacterized protein n=1 Tax=Diversispora epigaea TaxID=1348612 RepID=A0A397JEQ2_9GLOM|nr:hypothetical protein Glove_50g42 [Diversispora epigaea]